MRKNKNDIGMYTLLDQVENEPDNFYAKDTGDNSLWVAEIFTNRDIEKEQIFQKFTRMKSDYIINLKANIGKKQNLYIFFDYCNGGNLDNFKKQFFKKKATSYLNETIIQKIVGNITKGLDYIHSKNINHGLLSCANVLINYKNHENILIGKKIKNLVLDIEDFNVDNIHTKIKCFFAQKDKKKNSENIDTMKYMAPEILEKIINKTYDLNENSFSLDIWSLGVITFKLLTGQYPFKGDTPMDIYKSIKEGEIKYPKGLYPSIEIVKLINNLLQIDPKKRLSIKQIEKDDFLTKGPEYFTFIQLINETKIPLNSSNDFIKWYLLKDTEIKVDKPNEEEILRCYNREIEDKIINAYNRKKKIEDDKNKYLQSNAKKKAKKEDWYDFDNQMDEVDEEIEELNNLKLDYENQLKKYQKK